MVEMGAAKAGDIDWLCELARPTVALLLNAMPAHLEGFGSVDGVAAAKGEIFDRLGAARCRCHQCGPALGQAVAQARRSSQRAGFRSAATGGHQRQGYSQQGRGGHQFYRVYSDR